MKYVLLPFEFSFKMSPRSVSVKQIQNLDRMAIEDFGVPSLVLMENAGRAVAEEVQKILKGRKKAKVCVVCGLGNNAGDGFAAARHLMNAGIAVKIFLIGRGRDLKHDAAVNYGILKKLKYPLIEVGTVQALPLCDIAGADVVVDAIFGVGLNRGIREPFKSIIEALNRRARRVIAVDIPSGLDGTSGRIYGVCIQAARTVTFSFAKQGFFKGEGPKYAGKITVVDIGIPERLKQRIRRK